MQGFRQITKCWTSCSVSSMVSNSFFISQQRCIFVVVAGFDNKAVTDVLDDSAIVEDAARSEGCELIPEKTRIVILYMRRR